MNDPGGSFDPHIYISKHKACIDEIMAILSETGKTNKELQKARISKETTNMMELMAHMAIQLAKKQSPKMSYASVASTTASRTKETEVTKYGLIISTKDDNMEHEELKKKLQKNVSVTTLGIGISGIKKISNNRLIVTCEKKDDSEKLQKEINKQTNTINIMAEEVKKKKPCIIFKGVENEMVNEKYFLESILAQNEDIKHAYEMNTTLNRMEVKKIIKRKTTEHSNIIVETSGTMRKIILNKNNVNLGYYKVKVEDCSPTAQCYHCLKYNHTSIRCLNKTKEPACSHCAGNHKYHDCPNKQEPPKCKNCILNNERRSINNPTNHSANNDKCEYKQIMLSIARQKIDY